MKSIDRKSNSNISILMSLMVVISANAADIDINAQMAMMANNASHDCRYEGDMRACEKFNRIQKGFAERCVQGINFHVNTINLF
ncbi:MAG: hypothetical protein U1F42_09765 [Candidatus Competibacteraceae bacterium]